MRLRLIFVSLFISPFVVNAQTIQPADQPSTGGIRLSPQGGKINLEAHPAEEVVTIQQLVNMSSVILQGTVMSSLIPINSNANRPEVIETHSLIAVDKVLSGTLPAGVRNIVLAQQGGKLGVWETEIEVDPLVTPGEQYVLFLTPDKRAQPANTTGSPRFSTVGVWAGRAKIVNNKVSFLPRNDNRLRAFDNTDVGAFLAIVDGHIHHTIIPPPRAGVPFPGPNATITKGTGPNGKPEQPR